MKGKRNPSFLHHASKRRKLTRTVFIIIVCCAIVAFVSSTPGEGGPLSISLSHDLLSHHKFPDNAAYDMGLVSILVDLHLKKVQAAGVQ